MIDTHAESKTKKQPALTQHTAHTFTSFHVIFIRAIQMNWIKVIAIDSVPRKNDALCVCCAHK